MAPWLIGASVLPENPSSLPCTCVRCFTTVCNQLQGVRGPLQASRMSVLMYTYTDTYTQSKKNKQIKDVDSLHHPGLELLDSISASISAIY